MFPALSTDRLQLRPVGPSHLPLMIALNADPAVMTYIRGRAATPGETTDEWRQRLQHQSDAVRGLGYWAGFEADTFVGWWSASSFESCAEISGIGYRLHTDAWGRGLATEGARAMIRQAFRCPDIERVVATTMAINTGSRRVLAKLSMSHTSSWVDAEEQHKIPGWEQGEVCYELTRADLPGDGQTGPRSR